MIDMSLRSTRAIADAGMICGMTTGGYGISLETARRMRESGITFSSVSVDGLEESHDRQRGKQGSWRACFQTMAHYREVGLTFGCNTQLNRLSAPEIPRLYECLRDAGAEGWQYQMTVPMGNAADNAWLLLQPCELLDLYPMLARVTYRANAEGVAVMPGSSIGYFSPYEHVIRARHFALGQFWMGCQAGLAGIGIESDGKVKGDPSLPTDYYVGGNIREKPLREIMEAPELKINMGGGTPEGTKHLWGFCRGCRHADLCRGGCSWTAHVFFNRRGNNPYCHHRALEMARRGLRERVAPKLMAIGKPFDNGVMALIEEPLDAPWPAGDALRFTKEKVVWPAGWESWPPV